MKEQTTYITLSFPDDRYRLLRLRSRAQRNSKICKNGLLGGGKKTASDELDRFNFGLRREMAPDCQGHRSDLHSDVIQLCVPLSDISGHTSSGVKGSNGCLNAVGTPLDSEGDLMAVTVLGTAVVLDPVPSGLIANSDVCQ
jgi:hypothetical protein